MQSWEDEQEGFPIIYEEPALSEKIPIKYYKKIEDKRYSQYVIYESYKPTNFRTMQDYIHFTLNFRKIPPNYGSHKQNNGNVEADDILNCPDVAQEIKNYYNSELDAKIPKAVIFIIMLFSNR